MCITIVFGCSKELKEGTTSTYVKDNVSVNFSKAFAYAITVESPNLKSGLSDSIGNNSPNMEENMLSYLSNIYGSDFEQFYYENKVGSTPDISNYENLSDLSFDELDEDNIEGFVEKIFANTKSGLKSTNSFKSTSTEIQNKLDDFVNVIENSVKIFAIESIEEGTLDELKFKNVLLETIQEYSEQVDWQNLSTEEQVILQTSISIAENNVDNFISYSLSYSTVDDTALSVSGLKSSQGFLKDVVKFVAKATVIVVCMVGCTCGGAALGGAVSGGTPFGVAAGAAAGATTGFFATVYLLDWIDKW